MYICVSMEATSRALCLWALWVLNLLCPWVFLINLIFQITILLQLAFPLRNSQVFRKNLCLCGWQPFFLTNFPGLWESSFCKRSMIPQALQLWEFEGQKNQSWMRTPTRASYRTEIYCSQPSKTHLINITSKSTVLIPASFLLLLFLCICCNLFCLNFTLVRVMCPKRESFKLVQIYLVGRSSFL